MALTPSSRGQARAFHCAQQSSTLPPPSFLSNRHVGTVGSHNERSHLVKRPYALDAVRSGNFLLAEATITRCISNRAAPGTGRRRQSTKQARSRIVLPNPLQFSPPPQPPDKRDLPLAGLGLPYRDGNEQTCC